MQEYEVSVGEGIAWGLFWIALAAVIITLIIFAPGGHYDDPEVTATPVVTR